jgi:hypothetical protein
VRRQTTANEQPPAAAAAILDERLHNHERSERSSASGLKPSPNAAVSSTTLRSWQQADRSAPAWFALAAKQLAAVRA